MKGRFTGIMGRSCCRRSEKGVLSKFHCLYIVLSDILGQILIYLYNLRFFVPRYDKSK